MYISVHATDPDLRATLLGRTEPVDVMERIDFLASHGIQMHAQVVLCPGLNDGQHLKRTVYDLARWYPAVESVGIVPLGLTRYRQNLPRLDPVTPEVAEECLESGVGMAAAASQEVRRQLRLFRRRILSDGGPGRPRKPHITTAFRSWRTAWVW